MALKPLIILRLEDFAGPSDVPKYPELSFAECLVQSSPTGFLPKRRRLDPVELERAENLRFGKLLAKIR